MNLFEYFEDTKGIGVLATADSDGNVDIALYARPHIENEETAAFIMNDKLSYHNLESNPKAAYLFQEDGPGHKGKRLYLTKINEEADKEKIDSLRRKTERHHQVDAVKHLVYFRVDKIRPIVGD